MPESLGEKDRGAGCHCLRVTWSGPGLQQQDPPPRLNWPPLCLEQVGRSGVDTAMSSQPALQGKPKLICQLYKVPGERFCFLNQSLPWVTKRWDDLSLLGSNDSNLHNASHLYGPL